MSDAVNRLPNQSDVIVAVATPPGRGAIAILRVDGARTVEIIRSLFRPASGLHPADAPRRAVLGRWISSATESNADPEANREIIDEGLTIFFRAPHSFTGNDLAELQCHGGPAVTRSLLREVIRLGARLADPGEFTRRAFLNGRMDLAQAEAVADLIRAETGASLRAAQAQLSGGLSQEIEYLRQMLITLAAEIEARIDFPDEDLEEADLIRFTRDFEELRTGMARLLDTRRRGRLLRDGARVALIGPPNAGKSSLFNALAKSDRAIVTPHPGTTRDAIECGIDLGGVPVTLVDTAGLRESEEPIERLGIERSRRAMEEADFVIEVRDATGRIAPLDLKARGERAPDLVVENKIDLEPVGGKGGVRGNDAGVPVLRVSALTGEGLAELEWDLERIIGGESGEGGGTSASVAAIGERHAALLVRASEALAEARRAWDSARGGELIMIDLRAALAALDETLGLNPSDAILDRIFERFCIGK